MHYGEPGGDWEVSLTVSVSPMSIAELIADESPLLRRSISSITPCISPPGRPWKSIVAADESKLHVLPSDLQAKISVRRKPSPMNRKFK